MKVYSLKFSDQAQETKFQDKAHNDRVGLLRLYLAIKICLAFIEIIFDSSQHVPLSAYRQSFVVLGSFTGCYLISLKKSIKVTMITNFIQVAMPVVAILSNGNFSLALKTPSGNLFMLGGFKAINMATLYLLGTNYISNSICFTLAASLLTYTYYPPTLMYATNYIAANLWFLALRYISDKNGRNQYLLKIKDEYWTHVMKDMINDWVIVLTHDREKDQISVRDANQNFQRSCQIFDDKGFRTFARTIYTQACYSGDESLNEITLQQIMKSHSIKNICNDTQLRKFPNLEIVLRDNLIKKDPQTVEQQMQKKRTSFVWKQKIEHVQVKKFIGVSIDFKQQKYTVFQIRLIQGSDSEAFLLLIIKQLKTRTINQSQPKCLMMKNNLLKQFNISAQYLRITEQMYNNAQEEDKYCMTRQPSNQHNKIIQSSKILTVTNSHFTQQLYMNQMYNIANFKFDSFISSIDISRMIQSLKQLKQNQINIIFDNHIDGQILIKSFQRELTHLLLIFIENTIKHSNLTHPVIKIELEEEEQGILMVKIRDFGKGISITLLRQLLDSYKINISRKQKIQIMDHANFNLHIRQQMRYGWVAARLLLSILSPVCSFKISSNENVGCMVTFLIYKDINFIVNLRKLDQDQDNE